MNDLPDYELPDYELKSSSEAPLPEPRSGRLGLWVLAVLLVAFVGAAVYYATIWRARPLPEKAATPAPATKPTDQALGGTGEAIALPPLDASDSVVNTLVRALSSSPAIVAWLTTNGLIRNFVTVMTNIADGATPAKHLKPLSPRPGFPIETRNRAIYVDPRGYDRYNAVADAVASVDPAGAARLYATLRPLIEEANRSLVSSDQSFDRTLERAIIMLLNTPILDHPERLRPKGIGYAYDDERLEALRGAQKQLLRMGPRNVRIIQDRLREIALALGIQPAQLPPR